MAEQPQTGALLNELRQTFDRAGTLMSQLLAANPEVLPPDIQTTAKEVGQLLPELNRKIGETRKALKAMSDKTAPAAAEATGEAAAAGNAPEPPETHPNKRRRKATQENPVVMGTEKFIDELRTLLINEPMPDKQFLPPLFRHSQEDRIYRVSQGLRMAVSGLNTYDLEELIECMGTHESNTITNAIKADLKRVDLKDLRTVPTIYLSIEAPGGLYTRQSNSTYLQSCTAGILALRFAVFWEHTGDGQGGKIRKGAEIIKSYTQKENIQIDLRDKKAVKALKETAKFKSHKVEFNAFKTGAVRYLQAYRVLGSILLICPLLDFLSFKDPTMATKFHNVLPDIDDLLEVNPRRRADQEGLHRALVQDVFGMLPAGKELLLALEDIEKSGLAPLTWMNI